ncbi:hypothetical protein [Tenacibaculum maritimum]|uniref:hypothetical protein n=1 Tax=Tenacibaculum maritimum TaxID=107401 RepID=UPI0012E62E9F|nr:hypothetical protein [Tenacibaculum maritimum]CAA0164516.1 conserved exported hypothetical protein [Tenacibaculum maritimum]
MAYMVRGILFFGCFLLLCLQLACGQQTSVDTKKREMKSIDRMKGSYIDERLPKHGYYLQINHQNCHYEIRVNDLESAIYRDPEPVMSIRVPINPEISKSGTQSLSIRVFPIKGAFLSKMADLSIGLFYYTDMSDEENSYGELVHLLDWELPKIENEETPMVRLDTVFKATVPYEIKDLDYALDLSNMDKEELLKEAEEKYKEIQYYSLNNFDKIIGMQANNPRRMTLYTSEEEMLEVREDNKKSYQNPAEIKYIQKIENFELALYAYGKILALKRIEDGSDVICKAQTLTEDHPPYYKKGDIRIFSSLPIYLYKDKRDNQWHIW